MCVDFSQINMCYWRSISWRVWRLSFGKYSPRFQRSLLSAYSGSEWSKRCWADLMLQLLRNVRNYLPIVTTSYPRRFESSSNPLWELHTSQFLVFNLRLNAFNLNWMITLGASCLTNVLLSTVAPSASYLCYVRTSWRMTITAFAVVHVLPDAPAVVTSDDISCS